MPEVQRTGRRVSIHAVLTWARPIYFAFLLCGLIPFVLIYVLLSKRGRVTVGICPLHRRKRRKAIIVGWLTALAGFGPIIAAGVVPESAVPFAVIGGFLLTVTGLIVGMRGSQILVARRIDKHFIWLSQVSPAFFMTFPDLNAERFRMSG
jgi:hypothetical protein